MCKALIAIAIVGAACLVAGCGSSSDETAEAAEAKAQFIKQAETICNETRREIQKAAAAWEKTNGKSLDIDTALEKVVGPLLKQEAKELRALEAPDGDEAKLSRMIESLSRGAATSVKDGANGKSSSSIEAFQRDAEAYGLSACRV